MRLVLMDVSSATTLPALVVMGGLEWRDSGTWAASAEAERPKEGRGNPLPICFIGMWSRFSHTVAGCHRSPDSRSSSLLLVPLGQHQKKKASIWSFWYRRLKIVAGR